MLVTIADTCVQCGECVKDCAVQALAIVGDKVQYDPAKCMACGHCFAVCPTGSITFKGFKAEDAEAIIPRNDLEKAIMTRRSIRKFKDEALDHKIITDLLNLTLNSPSANNGRSLKFIVVSRKKLNEIAIEAAAQISPKLAEIQEKIDVIFRGAPHMIVCVQPETCEMTQVHDSTIALTTIELAAVHQGLGTFWCGFFEHALANKDVATKIGVPTGYKTCGVLGIGKPDITYQRMVLREKIVAQFIE